MAATVLVRTLRSHGFRGACRVVADRLEERILEPWYERRLGIETRGTVSRDVLGYDDPDCHPYGASSYGNLRRILRALRVQPGSGDLLVDFGSGKGRVLVRAALEPFERIIGVERSPDLSDLARRNIERARARLACQNIDVVTADAAAFDLPDAATIVFFASPFAGAVLDAVLDHIEASLTRAPRRLRVVSHGYDPANAFEQQIRGREWLALRVEVRLQRGHCAWIYANSRWNTRAASDA
jgi:SAM-dependent methyltransferase